MYILVKKAAAAYALLMFSLTVMIGILCRMRPIFIFIRAFEVFLVYGIVGWLLAYLFFFEDV